MNTDVQVRRGVSGTIVVVSAWCCGCRKNTLPDRSGRCMFCERRILDEDRLPAAEMLRLLAGASPGDVEVGRPRTCT